jgi:S-adenosylmethionine decarboxylase
MKKERVMSIKKAWGQHLVLNIANCNDNICKKAAIRAFTKELVEAIRMKAYGEPIIEHFAEYSPDAAGYSLVQLIETSSITGHFSDKNKDAYLDIFSCKAFDNDKALEVVEKYFTPQHIHMISLVRDAKQHPESPFIKIK